MSRYYIRKGPLECYYIDHCQGEPVAIVSVVNHNLTAAAFAYHLAEAASWFAAIAREEIQPTQVRRIKPLAETIPGS